ncbi:SDR family NAD(P)-dependent oxidoreductase [Sphingomonas sp. ABOLE]|uniref:SDR family NAD(P)-dependent oxidoreductase n=1 Tax=Sphingomonas sp. ABOLE TaxID=1985878 RepID=UPI001F49798B|nr:SDR family NAD(P)-dependent oxidoreductase [Sphingomonas sp. ABOLE]
MKTWFITGISRGLGKALAQAALSRGDTVVGTVREGVPDLVAGKGALHVLTVDLTDKAAIAPAVRDAFERTGRIDVLVNNAGYGLLGALEEATDAEFERLFAVNVFAPFAIIRAALPALRRQGSGHILNITSIAGRAPAGSSGLYSATKSALEGLTQSLAQEIAPFGLKATAIGRWERVSLWRVSGSCKVRGSRRRTMRRWVRACTSAYSACAAPQPPPIAWISEIVATCRFVPACTSAWRAERAAVWAVTTAV